MDQLKKILTGTFTRTKKIREMPVSSIDEAITASPSSSLATSTTPHVSINTTNHSPRRIRIVQNFLLIWLDANIDELNNNDCRDKIKQLRTVVNNINTFMDSDQCVDYITNIQDEKVFMIISADMGKLTIPIIHDFSQLDSIYIFCKNKLIHERWATEWPKVKGIFTEISSICDVLKKAVHKCDQDMISISFVSTNTDASNQNLDQLDQSFMYTQILKEILLSIDFDDQHIKDFADHCREYFANTDDELNMINKFEQDYHHHRSIWWYTYESFLYSMLNRALRTMEVDTIIKMGFFLRDLHRDLEKLHSEQCNDCYSERTFTVYRGQGLSKIDFDKLLKTKGGLISFNNFLSTSKDHDVSFAFADSNRYNPDLIGVLFQITIDTSIPSTPFASIGDVSYFTDLEKEVLFSMHTIFRINEIKRIDKNDNRLWKVELTLTSDNDEQLRVLTERMREETFPNKKGWYRLGQLLLKMGQFDRAHQVYETLITQTSDIDENRFIYHQLGSVKLNRGDYAEAISFLQKALELLKKDPRPYPRSTAKAYNNIGIAYFSMGDYLNALPYYQQALDIREKHLSSDDIDIADSYNNIGIVYYNMSEYSNAHSFFKKALEIRQKTLPPNHPNIALVHNNIARIYEKMGEHTNALSSDKKALAIREKILPPNHPDLSQSYNNIAMLYCHMGKYSNALSFMEKTLEIYQECFSSNHPELAQCYNNIGVVYAYMGEYSNALSFYKKALEIRQKILSSDHLDIAQTNHNIGEIYFQMDEYSDALLFYNQALEIRQKILPKNHPCIAESYNGIGKIYHRMGEFATALSYYEKGLTIYQQVFPPNHPDIALFFNNLGALYSAMGKYSSALSFLGKSLEIRQNILPPNHLDIAQCYNNISGLYIRMGENSKALSFCENAVSIAELSLAPNHPTLQMYKNTLEFVKNNL